MNPRHALLIAVLASACSLAPSAYASGNGGQGHDAASQGQTQANAQSAGNAAASGYAGNGDDATQPATASSRKRVAPSSSNCGAGVTSSLFDCSNRPAGSGDNGQGEMGWQSMLPGSIQ